MSTDSIGSRGGDGKSINTTRRSANTPTKVPKKVTAPSLQHVKERGDKITGLTAFDYPSALLADQAGIDLILVGDSLANTALGYESTLPVTIDEMFVALKAVRRGVRRALLVADMPFGSYHSDEKTALDTVIRYVKSGAEAVKLEGGKERAELIRRIVNNGVPVMGHIGLTPQSVHALGGYRVQGQSERDADSLLADALRLEEAGAFAIVLEGIPWTLAETITSRLSIPTVGIGAGVHCDGQILVFSDLLGLLPNRPPKFVRQYLNVFEQALAAIEAYRDDIRAGTFPAEAESYEPRTAFRVASNG